MSRFILTLITITLTFLPLPGLAVYVLDEDFTGANFATKFGYDAYPDPNGGAVNYVNQTTAASEGLVKIEGNVVSIKADNTKVVPKGTYRDSVRLTSTRGFTHGLFIADILHMPGNACGVWPAFWLVDPDNWPANGEIDIIEGCNLQDTDLVTIHTSSCLWPDHPECTVEGVCGITTTNSQSYGDDFNAGQGGVYAMEWTNAAIKIWFFPRTSIPANVLSTAPDPSTFGTPLVQFLGHQNCVIDSNFASERIVINIDFCGDWPASDFLKTPKCKDTGLTCADYVAANPTAFNEAYWTFNSLKVFKST